MKVEIPEVWYLTGAVGLREVSEVILKRHYNVQELQKLKHFFMVLQYQDTLYSVQTTLLISYYIILLGIQIYILQKKK